MVVAPVLSACSTCQLGYIDGPIIGDATLGYTGGQYLLLWTEHDGEPPARTIYVASGAELESLEVRAADPAIAAVGQPMACGESRCLMLALARDETSGLVGTVLDGDGGVIETTAIVGAYDWAADAVALGDRFVVVGVTPSTEPDSYTVWLAEIGVDGDLVSDIHQVATGRDTTGRVGFELVHLARVGDLAWLLFQDGDDISGLRIADDGAILDDSPRFVAEGHLEGLAGNGDRGLFQASQAGAARRWISSVLTADGVSSTQTNYGGFGPSHRLAPIAGAGYVSHDSFRVRWFDLDGAEVGQLEDVLGTHDSLMTPMAPAGFELGMAWLTIDDQSNGGAVVEAPYLTSIWAKRVGFGEVDDPIAIAEAAAVNAERETSCGDCAISGHGHSPDLTAAALIVLALLPLAARRRRRRTRRVASG